MRLILLTLLGASLIFSQGCSSRMVYVSADDWVQPIEFSTETKAWLLEIEWPPSAYEDFNKIRLHNLKYREFRQGNQSAD